MKKKILIFIDWFLPGYKAGGPIQSIKNFTSFFGDKIDIFIVTSNKDFGEKKTYEGIITNKWLTREKYSIKYLDKKDQRILNYNLILDEISYDFVYFNSLFSVKFTFIPLLLCLLRKNKIILAPRGMLGFNALKIKKLKKLIFIKFLKFSGISSKIIWHATDSSEAEEIKENFGNNITVKLAPNLTSKNTYHFTKKNKKKNQLKLFFLSRISEKKNLLGALDYLTTIDIKYKISFCIIGPIEDVNYWGKCQNKINQLPNNIECKHLGVFPNSEIANKIEKYHVLLLPTLHENFGHVIMESFQMGLPVIISNNTPWLNLFEKKLGFDISLENKEEFRQAIEYFAKMDEELYNTWSFKSFQFAKEFSNNETIINQNVELFDDNY